MMTEPAEFSKSIVDGLRTKLESLDLEPAEAALLWTILAIALPHIEIEKQEGRLAFAALFDASLTPGSALPVAVVPPHSGGPGSIFRSSIFRSSGP